MARGSERGNDRCVRAYDGRWIDGDGEENKGVKLRGKVVYCGSGCWIEEEERGKDKGST